MWQGQPGWPQAGGYPDPHAGYLPRYQPVPPPMPRPSPVAGVPRGDLLLDALCIAALLSVLVLPWAGTDRGYGRPEVIVAVVLGLVAVALPYPSRMGLLGSSWAPAQLRFTKICLAAPMALCAATYYVLDAVLGTLAGQLSGYAPAAGAWLAVGAAALTAVPRRSDLIDPAALGAARFWRATLTGIGVAMLAGAMLSVAGVLIGVYRTRTAAIELRALVAWPAAQAVLLAVWVVAVWFLVRRCGRGDESSRLTLGAAGVGAAIWALLDAIVGFASGGGESVHLPFAAIALTMAAAAVATSPPLSNPQARSDAQMWVVAAAATLGLAIVVDLLLLAQVVVAVLLTGALTAVVFTTAACAGLAAIAADWARSQVPLGVVGARTPVVIAAAVQAFTGLILMVVTGQSAQRWEALTAPQLIAATALPAAAVVFVLAPAAVRASFPAPLPHYGFPAQAEPVPYPEPYPQGHQNPAPPPQRPGDPTAPGAPQ